MNDCRQLFVPALLVACFFSAAFSGEFGNDRAHTMMPPVPSSPADFTNMWDPFVLRAPQTGEALEVKLEPPTEVRVRKGFDSLPWNGRQIVRDAAGNWFVLVEQKDGRLFLATATGTSNSPYRPRGGDFAAIELVGAKGNALFPAQSEVSRASMAVDAAQNLHVIWHSSNGLWHTQAKFEQGAPPNLANRTAWTPPRQLVEQPCHPGDIMQGPAGTVVICYSQNDNIFYQAVSGDVPENVAGPGAGLPVIDSERQKTGAIGGDEIGAGQPVKVRPERTVPMSERESQNAVMDLAPDGSVYLAFRRDFAIWVVRRTPAGEWLPAERVAREYAFHPSIMIADGRPVVTFLHDGLRAIPLDLEEDLRQRAGGGSDIGYATLTQNGWRTGSLVRAQEIGVFRRGMWGGRGQGKIFHQVEQLGWPVMFRDQHGVVWALWQNTSRRCAYNARWLGEEFGEVQECRGPFNAPALAVNAEKHAPAGAADVGTLFYAAAAGGNDRAIFDRLSIPSLSVTDDREVLFLDCKEVAATTGARLLLNPMTKPSSEPALSPGNGDRVVMNPSVRKHGDLYVMSYMALKDHGSSSRRGLAISRDGVHFEKVNKLPADLPEAEVTPERPLAFWKGSAATKPPAYFKNPDQTNPARKFMRLAFSTEQRGTYWVEYSPDGKAWTERVQTTSVEAMRERGQPNFYDPTDPERPIRIYGRVYTETGRSWGVIWTKDLAHWSGLEHLLDVDAPYDAVPTHSRIGATGKNYTMRGQIFMDSVAGEHEDEIYAASVHFAEGLYFCFYWPGTMGRPLTDVGVAVSRDGFNFSRIKNGERILPLGPPGAWDSGYIFQMSPMLDGDMIRVYYRGTAGRREGTDGFGHNLTEIGVATMRVNGWTCYTPLSDTATITTIPIQSSTVGNRELTVNIETSSGAFAVEVLDASTWKPLQGFALDDCLITSENGVAVPVTWRGGNTLPAGRDIRLRFHLRAPSVRLYSFGFRSNPTVTQ